MDSEGIMLSEISQTETNTLWCYLFVESKIIEPTSEDDWKEADSQRTTQWLPLWGDKEVGEREVQSTGCKTGSRT